LARILRVLLRKYESATHPSMHVRKICFVVVRSQRGAVGRDHEHCVRRLRAASSLSGLGFAVGVSDGCFQTFAFSPCFTSPAAIMVECDVGARLVEISPAHLAMDFFERDLLLRQSFWNLRLLCG